jgi:hypothetical protein
MDLVYTAADEQTVACLDDPLLGDFMHPHRKDYPSDFVAYFRKRLLRTLANVSHHHVVTCKVEQGREVITGYAEWHRRHAGDKKPAGDAATLGENRWGWLRETYRLTIGRHDRESRCQSCVRRSVRAGQCPHAGVLDGSSCGNLVP